MVNLKRVSPLIISEKIKNKGCVLELESGGSRYCINTSSKGNWYNNGLDDLMAPLKGTTVPNECRLSEHFPVLNVVTQKKHHPKSRAFKPPRHGPKARFVYNRTDFVKRSNTRNFVCDILSPVLNYKTPRRCQNPLKLSNVEPELFFSESL